MLDQLPVSRNFYSGLCSQWKPREKQRIFQKKQKCQLFFLWWLKVEQQQQQQQQQLKRDLLEMMDFDGNFV